MKREFVIVLNGAMCVNNMIQEEVVSAVAANANTGILGRIKLLIVCVKSTCSGIGVTNVT